MEDKMTIPRHLLSDQASFDGIIGDSAPMLRLYGLIARVKQITSAVLLLGETGTGKELVARRIHVEGLRREKPFVPIDCSALTPTLAESELFGHTKGAFTGADHAKRGLLDVASEGTVFLDEVGELPIHLQAKFLRALQEKVIRPVGATDQIPINVRVIAATNRDLEAAVRAGAFRQDLFFRLNVIQISLPPLRERRLDIPLLVAHFLKKFSGTGLPVPAISEGALRRLMDYDWPGNVRELQNAIERAVTLSSESLLTADDFASIPSAALDHRNSETNEVVPLAETERRAILNALRKTKGDKFAAAQLLGMGKTTLYRRLNTYARSSRATAGNEQEES